MKLVDRVKRKPVEAICSIMMIVTGLAIAGVMQNHVLQTIGGLLAAFGGALFSYSAASVDFRERAREVLRPELEVTTRHLANMASKVSRAVQAYQNEALEAQTAIDRISQFTSSLYGIVNDLNLTMGTSPAGFQHIVETVKKCEEVAATLEELTYRTDREIDTDADGHILLKEQISSLRMQLSSAIRELADFEVTKKIEEVICPDCKTSAQVELGSNSGDSAIRTCIECGSKYHIHRDSNGAVFTRAWGGGRILRVVAKCSSCSSDVPVNFKENISLEERYCMNCFSKLIIKRDSTVISCQEASSVPAESISSLENRTYLKCPKCHECIPAIWWNEEVFRGVCKGCDVLIEAQRTLS